MNRSELVEILDKYVKERTKSCIKEHGKFHNNHEFYGVFLEEFEEVFECFNLLEVSRNELWGKIRKNEEITEIDLNRFLITYNSMIFESLQCMTVLEKLKEGGINGFIKVL